MTGLIDLPLVQMTEGQAVKDFLGVRLLAQQLMATRHRHVGLATANQLAERFNLQI